jgi:hypothetical protein
MTNTLKIIEIRAYPKHSDSEWVYNKFTGEFQNDGDENTNFSSIEEAQAYMDHARAAWNDVDTIEVIDYELED